MPGGLRFGRFELRLAERRLLSDGEPVRLGARAFDLLAALVTHRDRMLTKSELLDLAWPGRVVEEANVQVQVSALRKVLGTDAVATIPGMGYRLAMVPDDAPHAAAPAGVAVAPGRPTNIADPIDSLIGREGDIEALTALLGRHRLVTVIGPGGIGKTRLAIEAARGLVHHHPQGVWWVDLAALSAGEQIASGIAKAVQVPLGDGDALHGLAQALSQRRMLIVLDNCEHLAAPLAGVVQLLLASASALNVLATSQQALHLLGEQLYALMPLEVPPEGATLGAARGCSAVRLLERRATSADRRFALTDATAQEATALCRQLDGIPLAIEMAAARLPIIGFHGVQQQLADRLDRLRSDGRDAPARQRTLRLTLDWSHSLLSPDEQTMLRRLAVFAGSFGLTAALQAAGSRPLDESRALDALAGLVEKSLVKLVEFEPPRYRLLETTRLYAAERLEAAGEAADMRCRHGQALAALAESASRSFRHAGGAVTAWLADHLPDYDDLQLAFDRACERDDADVAAPVVTTLRQLDHFRGLLSSSGGRVQAAQALLPHAGPRAQALLHAFIASCGWVAMSQQSRAESACHAVSLWRELGDLRALHGALAIAATESARCGDHDAADRMLREAHAIEAADWPARTMAFRMVHEGWVAQLRGDIARYRDSLRAAMSLCERIDELAMGNCVRVLLASATLTAGDSREAIALARRAVHDLQGSNQADHLGDALSVLCRGLLAAGDLDGASAAAARAVQLADLDAVHRLEVTQCVGVLAALRGDWRTGALLLSHVDRPRRNANPAPDPVADDLARRAWAAIESQLGPSELARLRALGEHLDSEDARRLMAGAIDARHVEGPALDPRAQAPRALWRDLPDDAARVAGREDAVRHVLRHDAARTDDGA